VAECPLASAGGLKFGRLESGYIKEESAIQATKLYLICDESETNSLL